MQFVPLALRHLSASGSKAARLRNRFYAYGVSRLALLAASRELEQAVRSEAPPERSPLGRQQRPATFEQLNPGSGAYPSHVLIHAAQRRNCSGRSIAPSAVIEDTAHGRFVLDHSIHQDL
jgi:hypothetical protein